ncbi:MAG: 1-phosphofructokinase [Verrucomicrobiota bacterium]
MKQTSFDVVTLTPNPAIDRTVAISRFTPGAVNRVEQIRNTPGGKGVNVASALADKGLRVAATGFLGRENSGLFETLFTGKQIGDAFVRIAGETRTGIKVTDPVTHQTTDINFPGAAPAPQDMEALRQRIAALEAPWFALGGSLPPGVPPGWYRDLVTALKARGIRVALDTGGEPLRLAVDAAPAVIKPNIHELEALLGMPLQSLPAVLQAARGLVARGIRLVAVSMGKEGACFVSAEQAVVARPPDIQIGSTVGAGDAMVAGILCAQIRGLPLDACARMATAFSLEALTRSGRPSGSPTDIKAAMDQVTLSSPC